MERWGKLNDRQLELLRRIGDDVDPVTAKTPGLARTVYALRDRGLVTTPRRYGVWRAEITEAGLYYLAHGVHPLHPTRGKPRRRRPARPANADQRVDPDAAARARELIERLRAEGTVEIENPDAETRAAHRRAIHAAKVLGLVPDGYHLLHTGRNRGDLIMRLADNVNPDETEWNRIRLSARDELSDPAALVEFLATHPGLVGVSDAAMPQALRLVHALAEEAQGQGHKIAISKKRKNRGLYAKVGKRHFPIAIQEAPAGHLGLEIRATESCASKRWTFTGAEEIRDVLPVIIDEIKQRAVIEDAAARGSDRRQAAIRAEIEREEAAERAEWEQAMARARRLAIDERRTKTFAEALGTWEAATHIREFCDALEQATDQGHRVRTCELPPV